MNRVDSEAWEKFQASRPDYCDPSELDAFEAALSHRNILVKRLVGVLTEARGELRRLLDTKGITGKEASEWPEVMLVDKAIEEANSVLNEVKVSNEVKDNLISDADRYRWLLKDLIGLDGKEEFPGLYLESCEISSENFNAAIDRKILSQKV